MNTVESAPARHRRIPEATDIGLWSSGVAARASADAERLDRERDANGAGAVS
jgi:hypothetical protein